MSLLDLWMGNKKAFEDKSVDQILSFCGDGKLIDNNDTSREFREYLANTDSSILTQYVNECLESTFKDNGLVLQDLVNEVGTRLGFIVSPGLPWK